MAKAGALLDRAALHPRLMRKIAEAGSQNVFARMHGLSQGQVSMEANRKTPISPRTQAAIGVHRRVVEQFVVMVDDPDPVKTLRVEDLKWDMADVDAL